MHCRTNVLHWVVYRVITPSPDPSAACTEASLHRLIRLPSLALLLVLVLTEPEALLAHALDALVQELERVPFDAQAVQAEADLLAAECGKRPRYSVLGRWAHRVRRRPCLAQEVDRLSEDELDFLVVSVSSHCCPMTGVLADRARGRERWAEREVQAVQLHVTDASAWPGVRGLPCARCSRLGAEPIVPPAGGRKSLTSSVFMYRSTASFAAVPTSSLGSLSFRCVRTGLTSCSSDGIACR